MTTLSSHFTRPKFFDSELTLSACIFFYCVYPVLKLKYKKKTHRIDSLHNVYNVQARILLLHYCYYQCSVIVIVSYHTDDGWYR